MLVKQSPSPRMLLPLPEGRGIVEEGLGLLARGHSAGRQVVTAPLSCPEYHVLEALSSFNRSVTSGYDTGVVLYTAQPGRFTGPVCWPVNVS